MSRLSFRPRPLDIHKKLPIVKSIKEFEDDELLTSSTRNSHLQLVATEGENEVLIASFHIKFNAKLVYLLPLRTLTFVNM